MKNRNLLDTVEILRITQGKEKEFKYIRIIISMHFFNYVLVMMANGWKISDMDRVFYIGQRMISMFLYNQCIHREYEG
jgi:hypothetical protein